MPCVICPFCANDVELGNSWAEPFFGCPHCSRQVVLGEAWRPARVSFLVALGAGVVGAAVALTDLIIGMQNLPPPPKNPADKGNEGPLLLLNMCIIFLGVTSVVGQRLYRLFGERGGEVRLRRGLGRFVHYLDAVCAVWLIAWGAYALGAGRALDPTLIIGLILLVPAGLGWWRALRPARSPHVADSSTAMSELVEAARQEAVNCSQDYVDTHHLLLAIARLPDSPASRSLAADGATEQRLRTALAPHLTPSQDGPAPRVLFSPVVMRIVERAMRKVEDHGAATAKPEYLLLSLLAEADSVATRLIIALGIDPKQLISTLVSEAEVPRRKGR